MTVLEGCLRTIRSFFLLNANQTDGAKGTKGARGAKAERGAARRRGGAEKERRGEGAENERRAKLTKWGGQRESIYKTI